MQYLSAREAADLLGISLPTLYTYVSRGLLRSEGGTGNTRARRYAQDDVLALKQKNEARRTPEKLVEGALNWGSPLLESAITLIDNGHLYYRGRDAVTLSQSVPAETVAALIWTGEGDSVSIPIAESPQVPGLTPIDAFQTALPLLARDDLSAFDLRRPAVVRTGSRILAAFVSIAGGRGDGSMADRLQQGWAPDTPQAATLINQAIVLCADHELNVSSFTARCVASAGATPYAVVEAGLCALRGVRHGGITRRVDAFLQTIAAAPDPRRLLGEQLAMGQAIPGFGQRLYPEGDPRARALLDRLTATFPDSPTVQTGQTIEREVLTLLDERPTIDFALAMLGATLDLPPDSALTLFSIGRTIGWIGHAIEQYATGHLIRPRATYTGVIPS